MCNISNRRARGNHAKPRIEGSKLAQKRLDAIVPPVDQADFGRAPGHPEPTRFDDATSASLVFRPSPTPFRAVGLDRQTNLERRQEIRLQTKIARWFPACRKTNQKRAAQNDNVQQQAFGANG